MNASDGRDLDLNLLRVFLVVAETGSVTAAAARLYLTQPAVSAALKRLAVAVGEPLFARHGRGLVLTARGKRLDRIARPHLRALVEAALAPAVFDPKTSDATVRLGLSDGSEDWVLPPILRALETDAPRMRLLVRQVQFRDVGEALASGRVDLAVTVADELPAGTRRELLLRGRFCCLYDPRQLRLPRVLTAPRYLAEEHVIVSYNGDFRGIVEDLLGHTRRARCSVSTFHGVADVVDGTRLLATVPELVARNVIARRPHLGTRPLPFAHAGGSVELLMPEASTHDEAALFVAAHIREAAARVVKELGARARAPKRA
jgi:LysR family transcriptional activator of mexEF-oprN operon